MTRAYQQRRRLTPRERAARWRDSMPTKEAKLFNYLQTEHARLRPLAEQRDLLKRERAKGRLAAVRQMMKLLNVPTSASQECFRGGK